MRPRLAWLIVPTVVLTVCAPLAGIDTARVLAASDASIQRVSVDSSGGQGNGSSCCAALSGDGRYVAFESNASNLVPGDTNGRMDLFIHDNQTGHTQLVSLDSSGKQAYDFNFCQNVDAISSDGRFVAFAAYLASPDAGDSNRGDIFVRDLQTGSTQRITMGNDTSCGGGVSLSADGRYVAFASRASNLVPGDLNSTWDVFVYDRESGTTERDSVSSSGAEADHANDLGSTHPTISADGRYVVFDSLAANLVPSDTNNDWDVFLHDRQTGSTTLTSVNSGGQQADGRAVNGAISGDGRYVVFDSNAANLVSNDTTGNWDVFVHDLHSGVTERVSVASDGTQGNDWSLAHGAYQAISSDGRFVVFESNASDLVAGDTNGDADVFVHDRVSGATVRLDVNAAGQQVTGPYSTAASAPAVSADGAVIAFESAASDLVQGDSNGASDIFTRNNGSGATPAPPSGQGVCTVDYPYVVIDSRGSGENNANGTPQISPPAHAFFQTLSADVGTRNAHLITNPYPAPDWKSFPGAALHRDAAYTRSVSRGELWLSKKLRDLALDCPSTRVFLVGYSQGAEVTGDVYATSRTSGWKNVLGVALFGDPLFNSHDRQADRGTFTHNANGGLGTRQPFPEWSRGHILSYCNHFDPVCGGTKALGLAVLERGGAGPGVVLALRAHKSYWPQQARAAAKTLSKLVHSN